MLLLTKLITKFLCLEKEGQDIVKQTQILPGYREDEILVKSFMVEEILDLFQHWLDK